MSQNMQDSHSNNEARLDRDESSMHQKIAASLEMYLASCVDKQDRALGFNNTADHVKGFFQRDCRLVKINHMHACPLAEPGADGLDQ